MLVDFDPQDAAKLGATFRTRPTSGGVTAVFGGGSQPYRCFAAHLMASELGLPLVHAPAPVAGRLALIEAKGRVTAPPKAPAGCAVVLSTAQQAKDFETAADFAVSFGSGGFGGPAVAPPPATSSTSGADDRVDSCSNFNVVIGHLAYGFCEVSPLSCLSDGGRGAVYPNVVLRRAVTLNKDLYAWRVNTAAGLADVRAVAIYHLGRAGEVLRTWVIQGAWPVRWSGPSFDAMAARPAMEEIELCISGFMWI